MFTLLDRVRDTSTTTGTGTITVSGVAPATFFAFSTLSVGASFDYVVAHRTANEVEVGRGTRVSGTTFSRDLVLRSSNGNALVSFSAGVKDVFLTMAAASLTQLDEMLLVFTPMRYGAIGDGVTNDSVALAAALAAAAAQVTSMGGGNLVRVGVDLDNRRYACSAQLTVPSGVRIVGTGSIKAITGGNLNSTTPLITFGLSGIGPGVTGHIVLDCNFLCPGLLCDGPDDAVVSDVIIRAFLGYGLKHGAGAHGCRYVDVTCNEWGFSSAGYADPALRVAVGFDIQGGDFELVAPNASYCDINMRFSRLDQPGNTAGLVGVITGGHLVQGSSAGGGTATDTSRNIVILQGGQLAFQGVYIDNGPVELRKFAAHSFTSCKFLRDAAKSAGRTGFLLYASDAGETGDGLQIGPNGFDNTWLEAIELLTDGGTWAAERTFRVAGNMRSDGVELSEDVSRTTWPDGSVTTPGFGPASKPGEGFYLADAGDLWSYAAGGTKRLSMQRGGLLKVGDSARESGVVLDAATGTSAHIRHQLNGVTQWEAQCSADGNYGLARYSAGVLVNRALEIDIANGAHTMRGAVTFFPKTTADALSATGAVTFEKTSNTQLTIFMRGSDGTTRSVLLTVS